jgi:hypothetical protein
MSSGTCPNATGGAGTETCNGNGNGEMNGANAANQTGERFTFWQQLANAGLVEGSYTGIAGSDGPNDHDAAINAPVSRVSNAGWSVIGGSVASADSMLFDGSYYRMLFIGAFRSGDAATRDPAFTPEEAWNIDKKTDDGMPAVGSVVARDRTNGCTAAPDGTELTSSAAHAAVLDATYQLTNSSVACSIAFRDLF